MKMHKLFLLALACTWSAGAFAQWQWTDKEGRKVFSDRAPPPEVPASAILKQPGMRPAAAPAAAPSAASAPATPANSAAAPSAARAPGTDKELEEKKAQAEVAEARQKKLEDDQRAAARADNCSRAQRAKTTLGSERPIRQTNAKGELVILDTHERVAEARRVQGIIDSDCKR